MTPDDPVSLCLRGLAETVRQRGIGSKALAMLPIERLPDDAPVPEPLLLLFEANMTPEATAELLLRAAMRREGHSLPEIEDAPQEMLARLDEAVEMIADHLSNLVAAAVPKPPDSNSNGSN